MHNDGPEMTPEAFEAAFGQALAHGDREGARGAARALLAKAGTLRGSARLRRAVGRAVAAGEAGPFRRLSVVLLASFTADMAADALVGRAAADGLALCVRVAPFGRYAQEILDAGSDLYTAPPDVAILAVEGGDLAPGLYDGYDPGDEAGASAAADDAVGRLAGLAEAFSRRSAAPLLVHTLAPPARPAPGILDQSVGAGQAGLIHGVNARLRERLKSLRNVRLVDYAGLVHRHGAAGWYDERMRLLARAPIAAASLDPLAGEHLKHLRALAGLTRRLLVLDLDGTLWGGVLGEDGIDGIALGDTYPGNAFVAFQRAVDRIRRRGAVLAAVSKNHPDDVRAAFERHPAMVLKPDDFAEIAAGWRRKPDVVAGIAQRLGLGFEHVAFVDDDPVERARMRAALPAVETVDLPAAPEDYAAALLDGGLFEGGGLTAEDRERTALYRRRAEAEAVRAGADDLEAFYRDLAMVVRFEPLGPATLGRAAQLTHKTNQFNATGRRYGEAELARMAQDPAWIGFLARLDDRFGTHGLVGLVLARSRSGGEVLEIDTFLLSCRALGRTVETAMLARLAELARARGAKVLAGRIVPGARNEPVRDLYCRHGFREAGREHEGAVLWEGDPAMPDLRVPEWIRNDGADAPSQGNREGRT